MENYESRASELLIESGGIRFTIDPPIYRSFDPSHSIFGFRAPPKLAKFISPQRASKTAFQNVTLSFIFLFLFFFVRYCTGSRIPLSRDIPLFQRSYK
jgi:hypothetical protein